MASKVASIRWTYFGIGLALIGPGLVAILANSLATDPESLAPRLAGLAIFLLLFCAVLVIARSKEGLDWRDVGFSGSNSWSVIWAIPLTAFFVFVFGPLLFLVLQYFDDQSVLGTIDQFRSLPGLYLFLSIILVAGIEEWFYRGYAIERLTALTENVWLSGAISLFVFGLVHFPIWGGAMAISTIVSGAILTLIYVWKRDILLLILAHVATDLIGFLA